MGIGSGIFIFVIGAIITFALEFEIAGVDRQVIGYLLMGAGALIFVLSLIMTMRRRSTVETVRRDGTGGPQVTQRETRSSGDDTLI